VQLLEEAHQLMEETAYEVDMQQMISQLDREAFENDKRDATAVEVQAFE
jgi:hypothetical protein